MANKCGDLDTTFSWLIKDLKENGVNTQKTIVFCLSFKECGDIYDTLLQCLPETYSNYIAMFHAKTPTRIKDNAFSGIVKLDGKVRLVVATTALGMGVNIPDIYRVIHYGIPEDMEYYVQGMGRGGGGMDNYIIYHLCRCDCYNERIC